MLNKSYFWVLGFLLFTAYSCTSTKKASTPPGAIYDFSIQTESTKSDSLSIARVFIDGCRAKALGDFEGAISLFGQVLSAEPNNDAALFELGKIYFEYGRLEEASELLQQAAKLDKGNPYYQNIYGSISVYLANYQEAIAVFEDLIKLTPDDPDAYLELAISYEKAGNIHEAVRVFSLMEEKFGTDTSIMLEQYRLYVRVGMIDEAVDVLNRLILMNEDEPMFYGMLAELYEMSGDKKKASEAFDKLLEADPNNPDLLFKKAEYLLEAGDEASYLATIKQVFDNPDANIDRKVFFLVPFADSIDNPSFTQKAMILDLADRLVKAHPTEAKAFALNGDLLFYGGDVNKARENYLQSTSLRGDIYDVWVKLFNIDAGNQSWDSLIAVTSRSVELFPNQSFGYYYSGVAYSGKRDFNTAVKQYKRALPMAAGNNQLKAELWLRVGDAYHELDQHEESDNAYDQSLKIEPNNPFVLNNYAYYLSLRGERLDKAESMSELANQLVPNNASFLDTYAWVMYQKEDFKAAKQLLEKALNSGGSGSAVVLEHYGDVLFQLGNKSEAMEYWEKAAGLGNPPASLIEKIETGQL